MEAIQKPIPQHSSSNNLLSSILGLIFWVGLCFFAAFIGGLATDTGTGSWYAQIEKPSWNPPNWVFGPVWTVLYAAMGVAAWLVWRKAGSFTNAQTPLALFITQLALNTAWSLVFFGLELPGLALIDIALLWVMIATTIIVFREYSRTAALLLVPYIAWVTFATALNFAIWRLN